MYKDKAVSLLKNIMAFIMKVFFLVFFKLFGKPNMTPALKKTLALYKNDGFSEYFSLIRIWDAPLADIERKLPKKGKIIDLGCGDGIVTNFLAIKEPGRTILGIDLNKERIKKAPKGIKNTKFIHGDILKEKLPKADAIVLTHILHHLPSKKDQEILLKKLKGNLKKDATLVITEIVEEPFLKHALTWIVDAFVVPILFDSRLYDFSFHYRKKEEWISLLRSLGFKVEAYNVHKDKPFSHTMFICKPQ